MRLRYGRPWSSSRARFVQVPPMYSALKHQGQRLYEIARAGREVERPARPVEIYRFEIEQFDPETPLLKVSCSKGTYIRVLIEDLASKLGALAHVIELRRTAVGPFEESAMISYEQCIRAADEGPDALDALLLPLDRVAGQWPLIRLASPEVESAAAWQSDRGAGRTRRPACSVSTPKAATSSVWVS